MCSMVTSQNDCSAFQPIILTLSCQGRTSGNYDNTQEGLVELAGIEPATS